MDVGVWFSQRVHTCCWWGLLMGSSWIWRLAIQGGRGSLLCSEYNTNSLVKKIKRQKEQPCFPRFAQPAAHCYLVWKHRKTYHVFDKRSLGSSQPHLACISLIVSPRSQQRLWPYSCDLPTGAISAPSLSFMPCGKKLICSKKTCQEVKKTSKELTSSPEGLCWQTMKIQNGTPVMINSEFLENNHTMNKIDIEETCTSASKSLIIIHPLNYLSG